LKNFDVQSIALGVPRRTAFAFIGDPAQLPRWTNAFVSSNDGRAVMRTPNGELTIDLSVRAAPNEGTVDWQMTFPDRSVASAFSRLVELDRDSCVFTFVLTPPPVPLEQLEGALDAQSRTLAEELKKLKDILEHHE
jgi:hypothetical protein